MGPRQTSSPIAASTEASVVAEGQQSLAGNKAAIKMNDNHSNNNNNNNNKSYHQHHHKYSQYHYNNQHVAANAWRPHQPHRRSNQHTVYYHSPAVMMQPYTPTPVVQYHPPVVHQHQQQLCPQQHQFAPIHMGPTMAPSFAMPYELATYHHLPTVPSASILHPIDSMVSPMITHYHQPISSQYYNNHYPHHYSALGGGLHATLQVHADCNTGAILIAADSSSHQHHLHHHHHQQHQHQQMQRQFIDIDDLAYHHRHYNNDYDYYHQQQHKSINTSRPNNSNSNSKSHEQQIISLPVYSHHHLSQHQQHLMNQQHIYQQQNFAKLVTIDATPSSPNAPPINSSITSVTNNPTLPPTPKSTLPASTPPTPPPSTATSPAAASSPTASSLSASSAATKKSEELLEDKAQQVNGISCCAGEQKQANSSTNGQQQKQLVTERGPSKAGDQQQHQQRKTAISSAIGGHYCQATMKHNNQHHHHHRGTNQQDSYLNQQSATPLQLSTTSAVPRPVLRTYYAKEFNDHCYNSSFGIGAAHHHHQLMPQHPMAVALQPTHYVSATTNTAALHQNNCGHQQHQQQQQQQQSAYNHCATLPSVGGHQFFTLRPAAATTTTIIQPAPASATATCPTMADSLQPATTSTTTSTTTIYNPMHIAQHQQQQQQAAIFHHHHPAISLHAQQIVPMMNANSYSPRQLLYSSSSNNNNNNYSNHYNDNNNHHHQHHHHRFQRHQHIHKQQQQHHHFPLCNNINNKIVMRIEGDHDVMDYINCDVSTTTDYGDGDNDGVGGGNGGDNDDDDYESMSCLSDDSFNLLQIIPVTMMRTHSKQPYGMSVVWQEEFDSLFKHFHMDRWILQEVETKPLMRSTSSPVSQQAETTAANYYHNHRVQGMNRKFKMFVDSAKVRFCCDYCGHGWTSMKGRVIFWYELFQILSDTDSSGVSEASENSTNSFENSGVNSSTLSVAKSGVQSSEQDYSDKNGNHLDMPINDANNNADDDNDADDDADDDDDDVHDDDDGDDVIDANEEIENVIIINGEKFVEEIPEATEKATAHLDAEKQINEGEVRCEKETDNGGTKANHDDSESVDKSIGHSEAGDSAGQEYSRGDKSKLKSQLDDSGIENGPGDYIWQQVGFCAFKLFGQQCDHCNQPNKFERAMWYPEEVGKVLNNFYNKIGQVYYGFKMPVIDKQRRTGKPKTSHNGALCQACHDGVCADRK